MSLDYVLTWRGRLVSLIAGRLAIEHPTDFAKEMRSWRKDLGRGFEIKQMPTEEWKALPWWSEVDREQEKKERTRSTGAAST